MTDEQPSEQPSEQATGISTTVKRWLPRFVALLLLLALLWMVYLLNQETNVSNIDFARGLITIVFSIGTVIIAMVLVLTVLLANDPSVGLKDRFADAKEVLTLLLGILGTVIGFYFGFADQEASTSPFAINDVLVSEPMPQLDGDVTLTVMLDGGTAPFSADIGFVTTDASAALKPIQVVADGRLIRVRVPLSKLADPQPVDYRVYVRDSDEREAKYPSQGTATIGAKSGSEGSTSQPEQQAKPEDPPKEDAKQEPDSKAKG